MNDVRVTFKQYRWPKSVIGRFVAKRTAKTAAFWGLVFGGLVASKSIGYATVYPTASARDKLSSSIGSNVGLNALFGRPHALNTVSGYTSWYTLAVMVIFGSIWALLLSTKTFRGDEQAGRWELLLTGQTSARRASINVLLGLLSALVAMYVVISLILVKIGSMHEVGYQASAGMFLALAAVSGAVLFMSIGALASQLMPTRSRAAGLSVIIFGIFFVLRAAADTTSLHWLLDITPLGWIEQTQPLFGSQPQWLIPVYILTIACAVATAWLAGRRDLGESVFADKDTANPHYKLLNSAFGLSFRLKRSIMLGWMIIVTVMALFFSALAKPAANSLVQASSTKHSLEKLAHSTSVTQTQGATIFLGIIFFVIMAFIMSFVATSLGALREEEAEGFLDNLLVRSVSRVQWLIGRIVLIVAGIICAGLLAGIMVWIVTSSQGLGISFHTLILSGINAIAPAMLSLGIGVLAFGFVPRLTTAFAYGVVAWSFLINIISAGINLNHWFTDTSVFNHLAFAPAASPKWTPWFIIVLLGIVCAILGMWRFTNRDITAE